MVALLFVCPYQRIKTYTWFGKVTLSTQSPEPTGSRSATFLLWNGLSERSIIHPGQEIIATAPPVASSTAGDGSAPATYTVNKGDTLWSIAKKTGVALNELLRVNGLQADTIIRPGLVLQLPVGGFAHVERRPCFIGCTAGDEFAEGTAANVCGTAGNRECDTLR